MPSFVGRRAVQAALAISATLASAATSLTIGSSAWWIGASNPQYSTQLGILPSFADPSFIQLGNRYYAYATNNRNGINVQVATSTDFRTWQVLSGHDALPHTGPWTNRVPRVWAPDVIQNDQGKYVLHYSAKPSSRNDRHCIGVAVSDTPIGPFVPQAQAFACPLAQGGAIDSAGFRDLRTGFLYAVYKIDGNSQGRGGMCNNMHIPQQPTPIMLQRVAGDGFTKIGAAVKILDHVAQDGPLVEAPSLLYDSQSGRYVLFYSSGCYADPVYDVAYVFSAGTDVTGPYNRVNPASKPAQDGGVPSQRLFMKGIDGSHAPGGATALKCSDGDSRMVLHGYNDHKGRRSMYTARLQVNAQAQKVTAWSTSELLSLSSNKAITPSQLASLASNSTLLASLGAKAATAPWPTPSATSIIAADLPQGTDASSGRDEAPSLGDFLYVDGALAGSAAGAGSNLGARDIFDSQEEGEGEGVKVGRGSERDDDEDKEEADGEVGGGEERLRKRERWGRIIEKVFVA